VFGAEANLELSDDGPVLFQRAAVHGVCQNKLRQAVKECMKRQEFDLAEMCWGDMYLTRCKEYAFVLVTNELRACSDRLFLL